MKEQNRQSRLHIILFLFSALALALTGGDAYLNQSWTWTHALFLFLGTGLVILSVVLIKQRKVRAGVSLRRCAGIAGVMTGLVLGLVLINGLTERFDVRIDLTRTQQHTLAERTKSLLHQLQHDIEIVVFYVGFPPDYLTDLMEQYEQTAGGRVTTEIADPLVRLAYAARYGDVISGDKSRAIVLSGSERRDIDFTDDTLDQEMLNNAIIQVTRPARTIYFLTGHGERRLDDDGDKGLKKLSRKLLANNMFAKPLPILVEGIPEDADLIVIPGPERHFNEDAREAVMSYLENGGDALFLPEHVLVSSPDKPLTDEELGKNPSMNDMIRHWGLEVEDDIVVDLASNVGDVGSPATRRYMPHKSIVRGLDYTFFLRPRSIRMLDNIREGVKVAPLMTTASNESAWGESNRYLDVSFDPDEDRAGPVPFSFVVWEKREDLSDTRIIVHTDADFMSNAFIDQYSNGDLAMNMIHWLTEADYQALDQIPETEVPRLDLTSRQKRTIAVILTMVPFCLFLMGMLEWMKE